MKPSECMALFLSRQCRTRRVPLHPFIRTLRTVHGMSTRVKTCMIEPEMTPTARTESDYGLAIETSGTGGAVTLGSGDRVLESRAIDASRPHAVGLLPAIAEVCSDRGVEPAAIAIVFVSIGPGSFTGLRIGVTAARMIAMAVDARLVGVPTPEAIAQNVLTLTGPPARIAVLIDAKRHRVYGAAFSLGSSGFYECVAAPAERDPAEFLADQAQIDPSCAVLGPGVAPHGRAVREAGLPVMPESVFQPRGESVYALGRRLSLKGPPSGYRSVLPHYIRVPSAEECNVAPCGRRKPPNDATHEG